MIIDKLLDFFQAGLTGLLSLIPSGGELPIMEPIGALMGNLDALNYYLPIAESFTIVIGVLLLFPLLMGVTLSLWILAQLRGSSSRG